MRGDLLACMIGQEQFFDNPAHHAQDTLITQRKSVWLIRHHVENSYRLSLFPTYRKRDSGANISLHFEQSNGGVRVRYLGSINDMPALKGAQIKAIDIFIRGKRHSYLVRTIFALGLYNQATLAQRQLKIGFLRQQKTAETPVIATIPCFLAHAHHHIGERIKHVRIIARGKVGSWIEGIAYPLTKVRLPVFHIFIERFKQTPYGANHIVTER